MERIKEGNWEMPVATFERHFKAREEIRKLETENRMLKARLKSAQDEIKKLKGENKWGIA